MTGNVRILFAIHEPGLFDIVRREFAFWPNKPNRRKRRDYRMFGWHLRTWRGACHRAALRADPLARTRWRQHEVALSSFRGGWKPVARASASIGQFSFVERAPISRFDVLDRRSAGRHARAGAK